MGASGDVMERFWKQPVIGEEEMRHQAIAKFKNYLACPLLEWLDGVEWEECWEKKDCD